MVADGSVEGHDRTPVSRSLPPPRTLSAPFQCRVNPTPKSAHLTHFRTFACKEDCDLITNTAAELERSGFYWGPLAVEDAHRMLRDAPQGSFLIRDSRQRNVFFTLSYHARDGPVSVRIDYKQQRFSLAGSERSFPSLFGLLEHYIDSPKKCLRLPLRKWRPTLQELCRRRVMEMCGGSGKARPEDLPVTHVVRDFLSDFPHKL